MKRRRRVSVVLGISLFSTFALFLLYLRNEGITDRFVWTTNSRVLCNVSLRQGWIEIAIVWGWPQEQIFSWLAQPVYDSINPLDGRKEEVFQIAGVHVFRGPVEAVAEPGGAILWARRPAGSAITIGPMKSRSVAFSHLHLMAIAMFPAIWNRVWAFWKSGVGRWRAGERKCAECGYNLHGLSLDEDAPIRCPECGHLNEDELDLPLEIDGR
jgi:hypothetical protein